MEGPLERYQKMGSRTSFSLSYIYPIACEELSFIIRFSYSDLPKPLQSLVFQDALSASRLLPEFRVYLFDSIDHAVDKLWSQSAVSAATNLIQSVEAALPKQKKVMAVKEFKQAMVSHKRHNKCQLEDKDLIELPQDILLHHFSFLDMQSLISAGMVCRSWNAAANDNFLWQAHYFTYFEDLHTVSRDKFHVHRMRLKDVEHSASSNAADGTLCSFKNSFRRKYIVSPSMRFKHNRGYCGHCNTIVWVTNLNCPNTHSQDLDIILSGQYCRLIRLSTSFLMVPHQQPSQIVIAIQMKGLVSSCGLTKGLSGCIMTTDLPLILLATMY